MQGIRSLLTTSKTASAVLGKFLRTPSIVAGPKPLKRVGLSGGSDIAKCEWAGKIAPHMDVDQNKSKSFQVFRDGIRKSRGFWVKTHLAATA